MSIHLPIYLVLFMMLEIISRVGVFNSVFSSGFKNIKFNILITICPKVNLCIRIEFLGQLILKKLDIIFLIFFL
jgi:hypothetical protein